MSVSTAATRWWRWLALVPAAAILAAPFVANRVEPLIFGLPFLLAFITGWVLATSAIMALVFALDERADARAMRLRAAHTGPRA